MSTAQRPTIGHPRLQHGSEVLAHEVLERRRNCKLDEGQNRKVKTPDINQQIMCEWYLWFCQKCKSWISASKARSEDREKDRRNEIFENQRSSPQGGLGSTDAQFRHQYQASWRERTGFAFAAFATGQNLPISVGFRCLLLLRGSLLAFRELFVVICVVCVFFPFLRSFRCEVMFCSSACKRTSGNETTGPLQASLWTRTISTRTMMMRCTPSVARRATLTRGRP
jgi:hypothetical protein